MILIFIGKSGSGKDFARDFLVTEKGFQSIISHTTRPQRDGEIHAKDYYFITPEEFISRDYHNDFVETRSYNVLFNNMPDTWHYGTSTEEIKYASYKSVGIKDLQGAIQLKKYSDKVKIIYIHCDDDIREARVKSRGSFCQVEWGRRLAKDAEDFSLDKMLGNVDYYLDNTHLSLEEFKVELDNIIEIIYEEGNENEYERINIRGIAI